MSLRVVPPLFEKYVVDSDCVSDILNLCMVYDGLRSACILDNIPLTHMHVSFEAAIRTFVECNKHLGWARHGDRELIIYRYTGGRIVVESPEKHDHAYAYPPCLVVRVRTHAYK